jgi:hypothetical protein
MAVPSLCCCPAVLAAIHSSVLVTLVEIRLAFLPPHPPHPIHTYLQNYKPLLPPRPADSLFQGGAFVFQGPRLLWSHYDPATSAHADLAELVRVATAPAAP